MSGLNLSPAKAGFVFFGACLPSTEVLGYYRPSATRTRRRCSGFLIQSMKNKFSAFGFALLFISLGCAGIFAKPQTNKSSEQIPTLELNQTLTRNLKGGESDAFQLHFKPQWYARVVLMLQGVDVILRARDGQKKQVAQIDDPFGRVGPRTIELVADVPDDYLIEVTARPYELGGRYEIKYVESRPLTPDDRTRIDANNLIANGNALRRKGLAESNRNALVQYNKALILHRQINNKAGQAMALQQTGRIYEAQSDYRKALEFYSSALKLWRDLKDRGAEGYGINFVAGMNYYLGNLDAALPLFEQARTIHRELGNKEEEGLTDHEIGTVYRQEGNIAAALASFQKALTIFREVGAKEKLGYLLNNLGVTYRDIGDLKTAVDYENQALEMFRALESKHGTATALTNLASIYSQQGEMRKALSSYQEALPLCIAGGEQNCEARVYWRMASDYSSLGETQTALDYYAKSAAIYRRKQRAVELARMLNSSGALYSSLGEKTRAFELHNEALAVSRKAESKAEEATTLSHLAELQEDKGDQQKARESYQQALAISREIKDRLGESANLNRLGLLASAAGNRPEAIKLFEQALRINDEVGARYEGALALHNLGLAYDVSGDAQLALDYLTKALTVFRTIENRTGEAMLRYRVASLQKRLGHPDEARRNIVAALEIVETIRGKIASTDLRSSYFATVQEYYDLYIELLMSQHRAHPNENFAFEALQASEQARARSLLDLLREAKADVRQGVDAQLLAREKELLELINAKAAAQVKAYGDPKQASLAKSLGEEISGLAIDYETLQGRIRQSSPRYAQLVQTTPLTLADIQSLLDNQTLLLEYRLGNEHSYLWVASPDELKSFELPPRGEIEGLARHFYELLTARNRSIPAETSAPKQARIQAAEQELRSVTEKVSQILLGPVAASASGKRLVVVSDGELQYVPFGVLTAAAEGLNANHLSLNATEIISLPSIAVLAQLRRENAGRNNATKSVAVFADPVFESDDPRLGRFAKRKPSANGSLQQSLRDFDFGPNAKGLPRLFASRDEAKAIMALAPAGANYAALDFEANRERALRPDLNQYRVLHFATHGLLNTARPQLSGVVLSLYDEKGNERDGFLRLDQIYNLRLSSELVVLSACSTALGKEIKGEGMIGLTRGFMYAGAQRVIASLWKVDDEATAELMKSFYRHLLQERMPASLALQTAQIDLQRQTRWRSPYYWGAFTLQGDWR
jgi:CHAT domain-containing protein/Tfp pilus assembly protein PilF